MRDDRRFALVLRVRDIDPKASSSFDYAVCHVDNDTAKPSFVSADGLSKTLGDYPVVPSSYGTTPGIVSFEAEMQAVDVLTSAVADMTDRYAHGIPEGFSPLHTMSVGGLHVTLREEWMGIEIAKWVLEALGWNEGDRVSISVGRGDTFAVHLDRDGSRIVDAEEFGFFTASREWRLPLGIRRNQGSLEVPFAVADGRIHFELPADPAEDTPRPCIAPVEKAPDVQPLSQRLPIDYRWGPLGVAAVYAAVAFALNFV